MPGSAPADVPMSASERDEDVLLGPIVDGPEFDVLGDLEGTSLFDLVEGEFLPKPPLCDWAGWRNWRRDRGCRPAEPPQSDGLKSAFTRREGRLYKELMEAVYGSDWRIQLQDAQLQESVLADEVAHRAAIEVARVSCRGRHRSGRSCRRCDGCPGQ